MTMRRPDHTSSMHYQTSVIASATFAKKKQRRFRSRTSSYRGVSIDTKECSVVGLELKLDNEELSLGGIKYSDVPIASITTFYL